MGMALGSGIAQDQHPETRRSATRRLASLSGSVSLLLPSQQSIFVNLRDISEKGACVVRQGRLEIQEGVVVHFEARNYDSGQLISLRSKVRWVRGTGFNTYVGLAFSAAALSQEALAALSA